MMSENIMAKGIGFVIGLGAVFILRGFLIGIGIFLAFKMCGVL